MTTRIFLKLILTFVGLLVITAVGIQYLVTRLTERHFLEELERGLEDQARLAELAIRLAGPGELDRTIAAIKERTGARATLIRRDGTVLADSDADPSTMENHATRPEFAEALKGRVSFDTRLSRTVGREFLYTAIPAEGGAFRRIRCGSNTKSARLRIVS